MSLIWAEICDAESLALSASLVPPEEDEEDEEEEEEEEEEGGTTDEVASVDKGATPATTGTRY